MIFGNLNTKGFKFKNIVLRSWSQAEDGETFAKSCFLPGRPPMLYESGLITGSHETKNEDNNQQQQQEA